MLDILTSKVVELLKEHDGVALGNIHGEFATQEKLKEMMETLRQSGVTRLYQRARYS